MSDYIKITKENAKHIPLGTEISITDISSKNPSDCSKAYFAGYRSAKVCPCPIRVGSANRGESTKNLCGFSYGWFIKQSSSLLASIDEEDEYLLVM